MISDIIRMDKAYTEEEIQDLVTKYGYEGLLREMVTVKKEIVEGFSKQEPHTNGIKKKKNVKEEPFRSGHACPECGAMLIQTGTCKTCTNCTDYIGECG